MPPSLRALLITDPLIIAATFVFGSWSMLVSIFDDTGRRQARVAHLWSRVLLRVSGVRVHAQGLERILKTGSYVFASNHASYMDTPVVLANIPVQFRFLAKRGLFQIPLLGTHLSRAGHIPVPREDPRAAVKTMTLAADMIRVKKISVLIFPEGGRTRTGNLRDFKEGAAYIAIKAGVPIVPLALAGTREILPMGSAVVHAGSIHLTVGEPIETSGLTMRDRGRVTEQIRVQIAGMLGQSDDAEDPAENVARGVSNAD